MNRIEMKRIEFKLKARLLKRICGFPPMQAKLAADCLDVCGEKALNDGKQEAFSKTLIMRLLREK